MSCLKLDASKWPSLSNVEILHDINVQITACLTPADGGYGGLPDTLSAPFETVNLLKSRDCLSPESRAAADWPVKREPPLPPLPLDEFIAKNNALAYVRGHRIPIEQEENQVDAENQASFSDWAKVEVMGHQSHVGFVKTEAYGQAVLFRIDTPELPEREYVLEEPSWVGGKWMPVGTTVLRAGSPGVSVLVGAGSIYRIIPCTEGAARKAIERDVRGDLKLVSLPEPKALPEGAEEASEDSRIKDGDAEDFIDIR